MGHIISYHGKLAAGGGTLVCMSITFPVSTVTAATRSLPKRPVADAARMLASLQTTRKPGEDPEETQVPALEAHSSHPGGVVFTSYHPIGPENAVLPRKRPVLPLLNMPFFGVMSIPCRPTSQFRQFVRAKFIAGVLSARTLNTLKSTQAASLRCMGLKVVPRPYVS